MQQESNTLENECHLTQFEIETAQALAEAKENYRKIVRAGIARWVKDFQNGDIQLKTVDDLKKLIEMDIELLKDDF